MSCGNKCDGCAELDCVSREITTQIDQAHRDGGYERVVAVVADHIVASGLHHHEPPKNTGPFVVSPPLAEALQKVIMALLAFDDYIGEIYSGKPTVEVQRVWFALRLALPPECKESFNAALRIFAHHQVSEALINGVLAIMDDHRVILPLADDPEPSALAYQDYMDSVRLLLVSITKNPPSTLTVAAVPKGTIESIRAAQARQEMDAAKEDATTTRHLH